MRACWRAPEREVVVGVTVTVGVDVAPVWVGVLVVPVVVPVGKQCSATATTPLETGSEIDDRGVPGATFTANESFFPPTSVTVITH